MLVRSSIRQLLENYVFFAVTCTEGSLEVNARFIAFYSFNDRDGTDLN